MSTVVLETAPYAPPANVLDVIRHARKKGLADTVTARVLTSIGIPEGNVSRTLATFRFLHLIEDDGQRTATFERIARCTDEEYPELLAQTIREAYAPVFTYVDPAEDDLVKLNNVFRQHYNPQAQRTRMVTLFLALCREAGIAPGDAPEPRARPKRPSGPKEQASKPTRNARAAHAPEAEQPSLFQAPNASNWNDGERREASGHYALCFEMLKRLPSDHRWTAKQRIRWLQAITANVDLLVEVTEDEGTTRELTVVEASDDIPF